MKSLEVLVSQSVIVTVDEKKFTPEFMQEFRETFYPFNSLRDHQHHLAQLYVRGLADEYAFIEGYGQAAEMGIKFSQEECEIDSAA